MADLFSNMPVIRSLCEMDRHITEIVRHFPEFLRAEMAEELIDRAERRGAITPDTARALERMFVRGIR